MKLGKHKFKILRNRVHAQHPLEKRFLNINEIIVLHVIGLRENELEYSVFIEESAHTIPFADVKMLDGNFINIEFISNLINNVPAKTFIRSRRN